MQDFTAQSVRGQMKLPPEMQAAYEKIVKAGLKVMFDPKTRGATINFMKGPGDFGDKLGRGVASVILLLFKESNMTLPPQLIIPAGTELVMHGADVAREAGEAIDNNVIAEAMGTMIEMVFEKLGVDPTQLQTADSGAKPQGVRT